MNKIRKIALVVLLLCSAVFADNPYRILNNFNAGELSPLLSAREDLAKYQSGCSVMENLIPLPQGGAQKRPGTKYIAEVKTSSLSTRIIPFEYSTEQSYIIELGNQYMRFYADGAQITSALGTEDLSALSANLTAHWKLNETAASTAVDNAEGTAALDGTASTNASNITATGVTSTCFDFDGQHYVTVSDNAATSFGDGSNDSAFSIAAWVYVPSNASGINTIISKFNTSNIEWYLYISGNRLGFLIYDQTASAGARASSSANITADWYFVVGTYDGRGGTTAANGMNVYVDGVKNTVSQTNNANYVAMESLAADVIIGATHTGASNLYSDKIDNVAIFDKELTSTEVASLYTEGVAYEITTPFETDDLFELKFEQSADVLYITHPSYEPRKLSRVGAQNWTLTAIDIRNGPFRTQNSDVADFIAASATTGSVTLTATGCTPFVTNALSGHIPNGSAATDKAQTGALFKLVHPISDLEFHTDFSADFAADETENTSWLDCGILYEGTEWALVSNGTWYGEIWVARNYNLTAALDSTPDDGALDSSWEVIFEFSSGAGDGDNPRNVSTTGTEDDGDAHYIVLYYDDQGADPDIHFSTDQTEHIGIVEITAVASTTSATATVLTTLASTDATYKWSEGSWSNYRGWPRTATFFEDRLCFGGNVSQPDTIWASVTSDYENMKEGTDDGDALIFTLSSRQVNVIEWMIGKDKILIGTSGAEWTLSGSADEPLTPSNVKAEQHSTYGSADLQATLANESVLFFQRGAEKMRELAYNWELDSYVAPDMTILANLVIDGGVVDTAFQKTPDSILWCVRDDGEIPIFSYERKENITAWSRLVTEDSTSDSDFESTARIHGDPEDEIWVVVKRTINGSTVRYIEQFQDRDFGSDSDDAFYVDCGVTYDSTASSAMTGLTHLVGETVSVLADGVVFDDAVVSATGTITLKSGGTTTTASTVQMGLPYTVQLRTMPLSWVAQGMTIQGRIKRINEVIARWYESGDFSIGKDADTLQTYSISGQTTSQDRKTFPPGHSREGYIFIYQKSPEPLTVLSIVAEFQVQ
ncbi:MAG: LamG-like jellyroll fold domain-containing protein [Planctomycetota bacterium]|jgi:hypothetical protein